ncbi:hypothetical protein JW978_01215 [Candidatus Dojkabacteria bacterium]|nr:hypothetical protein [Candidatus Dojkabacteria bacterium]
MYDYKALLKINKPAKFFLSVLIFANLLAAFSIIVLSLVPIENLIGKDPITGDYFLFYKTHGFKTTFNLAWGIYGYRTLQLRYLFLLFFSIAGFSIGQLSYPKFFKRIYDKLSNISKINLNIKAQYLLGLFIVLLVLVLLRTDPVKNAYFADGSQLPREIREGMIFAAEILTTFEYVIFDKFLSSFYPTLTASMSIEISAIFNGLIYVPAVYFLSRILAKKKQDFLLLFLGIISTIPIINFLGYIETTSLCLAMIAAYILFGLEYLRKTEIKYFMLSSAALTLAILAHTGAILLAPSFGLLYLKGNLQKFKKADISKLIFNPIKAAVIGGLVLLPLLLISYNLFYAKGNVGNLQGGGDGIQFVPLSFDYANPVSQFVYYDMISLWHFIDIAWVIALSATFLIPVSVIYLLAHFRKINKKAILDMIWNPSYLHFLLLTSLFTFLVPLLWNHDFGVWGDWNISATFMFPSQVLTWYLATQLLDKLKSKQEMPQIRVILIKINMILMQLLFFFGLYLQLK